MLYITEYSRLAADGLGHGIPAGQEPAVADQVVAVAGMNTVSAELNEVTAFVMVHATVACHLAFAAPGGAPVATTAKHRIGAGETRYYGVRGKGRIATIAAS